MADSHQGASGHDHGGHAGHNHAVPDSSRAFAIGVFLNLAFVIAEFVYGFSANSLALLSDAGHNLSDVFGLLMAWGALHLARTLPSKRYTYGWRRSSILAALAMPLFSCWWWGVLPGRRFFVSKNRKPSPAVPS